MCESPTNNSLASWDSGMWSKEGGGRKRAARLCARNSFPFLPKTELIPVGYPCVGWLQLLRRRYTHRCLQIWLPPAASDWIQGWDSAPQNTTRKHKMASRTSAILGLLKNTIRSTFREFFFFSEPAVSRLRKSSCSVESDGESIACQEQRWSQQIRDDTLIISGYKVREQLEHNLSGGWHVHREKCSRPCSCEFTHTINIWLVRKFGTHWARRFYFWWLKLL